MQGAFERGSDAPPSRVHRRAAYHRCATGRSARPRSTGCRRTSSRAGRPSTFSVRSLNITTPRKSPADPLPSLRCPDGCRKSERTALRYVRCRSGLRRSPAARHACGTPPTARTYARSSAMTALTLDEFHHHRRAQDRVKLRYHRRKVICRDIGKAFGKAKCVWNVS